MKNLLIITGALFALAIWGLLGAAVVMYLEPYPFWQVAAMIFFIVPAVVGVNADRIM
jgi:hypothetical protein